MDFEKEHIIIFIVCIIVGIIIGLIISENGISKENCIKEQNEINVLTKEINNCLNQLVEEEKYNTKETQIN